MISRRFIDRAAIAALVLMPVVLAVIVLRGAVNLPFWDEWEWADVIVRLHAGSLTFAQLWAQHNEHRMLVPELLVVGIDRLRGWDTVEETLLSVTLLVATAWIASVTVRRTIAPERRIGALLIVAALLMTLRQQENLIWGFQFAWFMVTLAMFAIVELLGRPSRTQIQFAAAVLVGFAASYCMSSGLLAWPIGLVALLLATPSWAPRVRAQAIGWCAAAGAAIAIYFIGYQKPAGHPPLAFGLENPLAFLQYVVVYVGSSFAKDGELGVAGVVGCIGALAFVLTALRRLRYPESAPWIALGLFGLAGALITAVGRAGFGIDQALASRYVTLSTTLWVGLVGLVMQVRYGEFPLRRLGAGALGLIALLLFVRANRQSFHDQAFQKERLAGAYAAALDPQNATDADLTVIYPAPSIARARLERLEQFKDGPFLGR